MSRRLRASFMRSAAQILLRPTTPQEYDNTSAGRSGSYLIIKRLLPLFDRFAPDLTPALNARAALLLADVPERLRTAAMDRTLAKGIVPEEPAAKDKIANIEKRRARERATLCHIRGRGRQSDGRGDPRGRRCDRLLTRSRAACARSPILFVNTTLEDKDARGP